MLHGRRERSATPRIDTQPNSQPRLTRTTFSGWTLGRENSQFPRGDPRGRRAISTRPKRHDSPHRDTRRTDRPRIGRPWSLAHTAHTSLLAKLQPLATNPCGPMGSVREERFVVGRPASMVTRSAVLRQTLLLPAALLSRPSSQHQAPLATSRSSPRRRRDRHRPIERRSTR